MVGTKYKFFVGLVLFVAASKAVFEDDVSETSEPDTWRQVRKERVKCPAGQYITCIPCQVNKYKPRIGTQSRCADCKEGKGTLGTGSVNCIKLCKAGKWYNEIGSCEDCQVGTYMDARSLNSTCKLCPERMTTDRPGADSLDKCICRQGHQPTLDGRDCEPCPDGTYKGKDGNFVCTICPGPNTKSTPMDGVVSKENCTRVCDPGKQLNLTMNKCEPCEKNFYKPLSGSREKCKPCEPNTVAKAKGSTTCIVECGAGFEYENSTGRCKQCPWGQYKNKIGNNVPCAPCASNNGSDKVTLARGAKDRATECVKKSNCFVQSLQDLEEYYAMVQSQDFAEKDDIVSALNSTCFNDNRFTVYKVMQDFLKCPDLRNIILSEVKVGIRTYGHDTQMELLLSIEKYMNANPRKTYCDYLKCVNPYIKETTKCKSMMPKGEKELQFCSETWRVGATCVALTLLNCPALQFHPNVTEDLNLIGLKISDIVNIGNMLNLCGTLSTSTPSTTSGAVSTSIAATASGTLSTSTPSTTSGAVSTSIAATTSGTLSTSTPSTTSGAVSTSIAATTSGTLSTSSPSPLSGAVSTSITATTSDTVPASPTPQTSGTVSRSIPTTTSAVPVLECWDFVDSRNYAGTLSLTNGGRTCQAWSTNYPHSHSNNRDELFPKDDSVAAARNYCRDPDGEGHPWCYTTNQDLRWQFCDVPVCNMDCWPDSTQYDGKKILTKHGRQCQEWAKQTPHEHENNKAELFPLDGSVDAAENYCRDPDREGKPWCYTTDAQVRWEFCDIPICIEKCWPNSKIYDGTKAVTKNGRQCQVWAAQTPHEHINNKAELFPLDESVDAAKNYCRDPDGEGKPWCYTTDAQVRWEFCDIPTCNVDCWTNPKLYQGRKAITKNGRVCQEWIKQSPHGHSNNKPELFPLDGSVDAAVNYCRDPDGGGKPWCYTTDAQVRWEFCDIPTC